MPHESKMLVLQGITKRFGNKQVLQEMNLEVSQAEIFGLLGPSGSGKTTLVKLMTGIDTPTTGDVFALGTRLPKLSILNQIGYMAQSDALYNELSALENLNFFAALYGLKSAQRKKRIAAVMELVALSDHMNKQVSQYSGGMKRRLSLAISLLHEPPLLILDEPTVGIDPILRKSIWAELRNLSSQGTTIILTTHVMDEADKCDRLGMIRDGQLTAVGTPDDLMAQVNAGSIEEAFIAYGEVGVCG